MRVLTVVFGLEKGGTQRAAQNFCEGYAKLGHDSKILATYESGIREVELRNNNIKVWVGLSKDVLDEIVNWNPDLVHIHSHVLKEEDVLAIRDLLPNSIFVETNVFSIPSKYENILHFSYQLSNWCHFLYLAKSGSTSISTVVPYPVKSNAFSKSTQLNVDDFKERYGIPKNAFVFGRIGQSTLSKWSLYIADVFNRFLEEVNSNCYLIIVNPPAELESYIVKQNIDNIIIIDQIIGDQELRNCYSAIDLFLHIANIGESFGMVLAESMLCETPVITLSTPWADNSQCEVVKHEIDGMCATTMNEFYNYMVELYTDEDKRYNFGKKGRENIVKNYDYLAVAQRSIDIVKRTHSNQSYAFHFSSISDTKLYLKDISLLLLKIKSRFIHMNRPINFLLRLICGFNTLKGRKITDVFSLK